MRTKTIVLSLLMMIGVNTQAQNRFILKTHLAQPLSDFKAGALYYFSGSIDYIESFGSAGTGLGIGIQYDREVFNQFHVVVGLDVFRNPIIRSFRQTYNASLDADETVKYSSYYNIPLSGGLRYEGKIKEELSLFAGAGFHGNLLKVSKHVRTSENFHKKETYNPSLSIGFSIEGGVVIKNRYQISLGYKRLGNHTLRHGTVYNGSGMNSGVMIKSISLMNISFGLIL